MKKLLLTALFFLVFFSTSIAQKSLTSSPQKASFAQRASPNCPLSVSIQDNIPSAVCSELLKTLVAVTPSCTDTTAVSYSWSSTAGGVFSTSRTTTFNLPEYLVATPVTFTVTVVEGTETVSANYTITVNPRPSRPTLTPFGTIVLCDNNFVTLTSSACTGGSTTIWSNGASGVSSISVPPTGGTYYSVACYKNGCISDSTAAAALITGLVTSPPTTTSRVICEGTAITTGNGLQADLVDCNNGASGTYTYTGGTVGYDAGRRSTGSVDPSVNIPTLNSIIKKVSVSITWRKLKGGYENSCGVGDTESWPYHNETQFRVKSPSGKIVTLVNTNTYGGSNNPTITTVFEDGGTPINFYSPPVSGTFAPAQPLSGFIGENPTGTWTLLPYDAVGKDPLCVSGFSVTFSEAQNGTITWWDAPTGGNQVGTGSEFIPTITATGTYTFYAQGQCVRGCPSVRTAASLTIRPTPAAPLISVNVPDVNGTKSVCFGDPITLTATGCSGTVRWNSNQNGTNFANGAIYTFTPSGSNFSNITHSFTAVCEGSNLCKSVSSNSLSVVVKYKPAQPAISGPGSTICMNSNVTLTASSCSGGTLGWTGNRSGGSINFVLTSAVNIKVACTVNGCTSDSSNVYSITPLPRPNPLTVNASQVQALCYGNSVTLTASTCSGTVKWTGNLTGSPLTVTPLTSRSYRASCLGSNGCASDSSAALTIVVLPKTKPTITGSTFICGTGAGIPVTLTATGCSGANETVMWRSEDPGTTYTETIFQTKTFRAVCIRGGFCVSDSSDIFTVHYRNKPTQPTITTPPQNTTICQGSSVSLTASACTGGTLGWTGGLSGQTVSISPNTTKSYKVACTINGCTSDSSSAVIITVNPTPVISVSANKTSVCSGDSAVLTLLGCTGTISWSNGATTSIIKVSPATNTTYTATCTSASCSANQSVSITALSTPNVTASGILQCGQTVTLTANNLPVGSNIQWRKDGVDIANATNSTVVINSAGSYDFTSYRVEHSNISNISSSIEDLYFINSQVGFLATPNGMYKTINGGTSWIQVQNSSFQSVTFINSNVGWAVINDGTNGKIAKTIDGGDTWLITTLVSHTPFKMIRFRDANNGVIISKGFSTTYYTNNGGVTWSLASGTNVAYSYKSIAFVPNSSTIYMLGYSTSNVLIKSTDNGVTWSQIAIDGLRVTNEITFSSTNTGWITCDNGIFLKSTDGGNTWATQSSGFTGSTLFKIQFTDSQNGFTTGKLLKTNNGGQSWQAVDAPGFSYGLYFIDKNFGWWSYITSLSKYSTPQCPTTPAIIAPPQRPNAPTITPPTNSTFCQGSNITLSATGCTGGTYAWTGGLTGTIISVSPSSTRAYKVACTLNTCTSDSSSAVTINVNPKPAQPTINQVNPSICVGQSITLSVTPVNGATYTWTGGLIGTSITVSPIITKTYKVAAAINSCLSDSSSLTVSVTSVNAPSITLGGEVCSNTLPVKVWDKSISTPNGSSVNALIKTNDGGMFTVFRESSTTTIAKLDVAGATVWSRALFSVPAGTVKINAAVATADGGYLLAGKSNSASIGGDVSTPARLSLFNNPTDDFWILKIDANGVKQWDKRYGGNYDDEANDIIQTPDGGYLLGGITQSDQIGDVSENGYFNENSFWSVKIDANGVKQWDKRFIPQYLVNMNGGATLKSVVNTPDGGYLLGGYSKPPYEPINNTVQTNDYFVVKLNSSGGKQWEKLYNNNNNQEDLKAIQPTKDGGFLLAGTTSSNNQDVWIVKINSTGIKQWDKKFGGTDYDETIDLKKVPNEDNFLIGASSSSGIGSDKTEASRGMTDMWVIKIKPDGTKIWDKTIGGSGLEYLYKTTFDSNNDIILGGFSASGISGEKTVDMVGPEAWFFKIASNCPTQNSITICKGDSITLKSGCTGITTWSNGLSGSVVTVKPNISTTYTSTCTVNGCISSVSPTFTATVSTPSIPTINQPVNSAICQGSSITLSAIGCSGGIFTWTGGLTGSSISVNPSSTKAYKVTCALNSCTSDSSTAITITVNPKPIQPVINQTNPSICIGQNIILSVVPVNGATYTWTGGLPGTSISVSPLAIKIYKVSVTIAGCVSDSATVTVNVNSENPPIITLGSESCNNILPSKVWDKTVKLLGDSEFKTAITTSDGGTFSTLARGYSATVMAKFDNNGNTQWSREIDNPGGSNRINVVIQTNDGGYLVGGRNESLSIGGDVSSLSIPGLYSISSPDFWILKIDANGVRQWDKRYGGQRLDEIFDILKTSDGGYLLGGVTNSPSGYDVSDEGSLNTTDYWVVKIDATGNKAWDKRFVFNSEGDEAYNNELTSLLNTNDGGYLLGGHGRSQYNPARPSYLNKDYYLVKINSTGTKQWDKLYDNNSNETLTSMQPASDGGFLLVGNTTVSGGSIWTVKINSSGIKQWDKQFGGTGNDQAFAIKAVPNENNFIIAGSSTSGVSGDKSEASKGGQDIWILKIKSDGTKIWDKTIGGDRNDYTNSLALNVDGSIVIGGSSNSSISGDKSVASTQQYSGGPFVSDSWLVKYASNCPQGSSVLIALGDSLILKANPCAGTINWSNGMAGSSIVIKPTINTIYTATCSISCTSPASSPFNVTVSTTVCETIKSGSWIDPATWSCNRAPTATDDVIINTGHTITNTVGTIRAKSLNYRGGQLQLSPTSNLVLGN